VSPFVRKKYRRLSQFSLAFRFAIACRSLTHIDRGYMALHWTKTCPHLSDDRRPTTKIR
jgi:hypothetical protein